MESHDEAADVLPTSSIQGTMLSASRSPNTMNTRAPTDLHKRRDISISSEISTNHVGREESDAPDDELSGQPIEEPEWMGDSNKAKNKKKDRPWNASKEHHEDSRLSMRSEENVNIVGLSSNIISPDSNGGIDDDDDLSFEEEEESPTADNILKSIRSRSEHMLNDEDSNVLMDLPSRWSKSANLVRQDDVKAANIKGVSLAAERAAQTYDETELMGSEKKKEEQDRKMKAAAAMAAYASNRAAQGYFGNEKASTALKDMQFSSGKIEFGEDEAKTKLRLSSALSEAKNTLQNLSTSKREPRDSDDRLTQHERVRAEALKMLQLADKKSTESNDHPGDAYALRKTKSGGYRVSMKNREETAMKGLGLEYNEENRFSIDDSLDYDDVDDEEIEEEGISLTSPTKQNGSQMTEIAIAEEAAESKANSWSNRYSINHHMRAMHGGLTSKQVLKKMKQEKRQQERNTSATTLYKASPHDEENNEYESNTWNATSWKRLHKDRDPQSPPGRIWKTMLSNVSRAFNMSREEEVMTTAGSHRNQDHSSPRGKNVFTAIQHHLSPISRRGYESPLKNEDSARWRNINLADREQDLSESDFTSHHNRQKKQRLFFILSILLLSLAVIIGVVAGVISRHGKAGKNATKASTFLDVGETIEFYVTSDTPYNSADEEKLRSELKKLQSTDGDFFVHLGDVNLASVTRCNVGVYEDAKNILKNSPMPVLVLPGNEDWNDCPKPDIAFHYWMEHLNRFEENFADNQLMLGRQLARDENFAFLHNGVLFIGLNLVDGTVQSESEWSRRDMHNVHWVEENLNSYSVADFRALVILGHAPPTAKVGDFFWPIVEDLSELEKPVLYIHANNDGQLRTYKPFEELDRMTAVELSRGSISGPTKIRIDFGLDPFSYIED